MALFGIKSLKYFQPSSLRELLRLVDKFSNKGKIAAGGTDLVPQLKAREIPPPQYVFDIQKIDKLNYIKDDERLSG